MNYSWEDPPYSNHEQYTALCHNSKATDFYFHACNDDEGFCMVAIVPKVYFEKHKYMWDQSMDLDHLLPDYLAESMESIWSDDGDQTVESIRADMLALGFEEHPAFSKLTNEGFGVE